MSEVKTVDELDRQLRQVLVLIDDAHQPVGSRQLIARLAESQVAPSEATMARRLRDLDALGLTRKVGTKGRVATSDGSRLVSRIRQNRATADRIREASQIRTTGDLLNLLRARRAVEPEAVRDVVSSAAMAPDVLGHLVDEHRQQSRATQTAPHAAALGFHRELARQVHNPILSSMLALVFNDAADTIERTLDVVVGIQRSSMASVDEHALIARAVSEGEPEEAARLMAEHLDRLIADVEAFARTYDGELVRRLLSDDA